MVYMGKSGKKLICLPVAGVRLICVICTIVDSLTSFTARITVAKEIPALSYGAFK